MITLKKLLLAVVAAAVLGCGLQAVWSYVYSTPHNGGAQTYGMTGSPDGSVIVLGAVGAHTDRFSIDTLVLKLGSDGETAWEHTLDTAHGDSDLLWSIAATADGSAVVSTFNERASVTTVLDTTGHLLWQVERPSHPAAFRTAVVGDRIIVSGGATFAYDLSGTLLWRVDHEETHPTLTHVVVTDADDNIYVVGARDELTVSQAETVRGAVPRQAWVAKLAPDGTLLWQRHDGTPGARDQVRAAAVDDEGNLIAAAEIETPNGYDVYVRKLSPTGDPLWTQRYGAEGSIMDTPEDVKVDGEGNAVVVSMSMFHSRSFFTAMNDERVVTTYDRDGNVLWQNIQSGFAMQNIGLLRHRATIASSGDVYITGGHITHKLRQASGAELFEIQHEAVSNSFIVAGDSGEVYVASTEGRPGAYRIRVAKYNTGD